MRDFEVIGLTLPTLPDPRLAIAVARAGGVGIVDMEWASPGIWIDDGSAAVAAVRTLAQYARGRWGVKLDGEDEAGCDAVAECLRSSRPAVGCDTVILTEAPRDVIARQVDRLRSGTARPNRILMEIIQDRCLEFPGIDGFVAKGEEAGGLVGAETTFILLQRLSRLTSLPIFAHGGIGLHSAAACRASGAAGIVLDMQLCLSRESPLPRGVRDRVIRMDGSDTIAIGQCLGFPFRSYHRPGHDLIQRLQAQAENLWEGQRENRTACFREWKCLLRPRVGFGGDDSFIWPLGPDAAMARSLAERFLTAGRIVQAMRQSADDHVASASARHVLGDGAPLARSHGTRFPIVQGPMTRVSDNSAFALEVARGGALPFISLALSDSNETSQLMQDTRSALGDRPWGVGILGFVPLAIRTAQLEVIRAVKPPFALIAGGRPDQAAALEQAGVATYLHTPSPDLLRLYFEEGARRFVFEGRECGGHVGPRSSFVLWDAMTEVLCSLHAKGVDISEVHVLFAGGIHDALSAAMVSALAAPLVEAGTKVGVLLGTAYLFTHEALATGAISPAFQDEATRCEATSLLETGPGHMTRCARTPFVDTFEAERRRIAASGASADELRDRLEELSLGRLRLASKGLVRRRSTNSMVGELVEASRDEQTACGMYMLGQLAAVRSATCSIFTLHQDITVGSCKLLEGCEPAVNAKHAPRPCEVAIVGLAALLPGAPDVRSFWDNVLTKADAITEVPLDRFDWRLYFDPDPGQPDKIYSKWGGFLSDVLFDPVRYGIPPASIPSIEPMQLLALDVVGAALADAGYAHSALLRSKTAVFLGAGGGLADLGQQYGLRSGLPMLVQQSVPGEVPAAITAALPEWTEDSFSGLLLNVAAGRVANRFDLGGINFTVDAACASSLAAIYLGIRELESRASDVVIAGGVDTVQNPFGYLCFSKTKALSPGGRCRPFDAGADGTVISEGLAVVVLKRLADAERDGDRIYAVIRSVGGSSDGRDKGLTAPRPEGQIAALRRAYETAGISPTTVGLIEAHGTGTAAGDAAEVEALKRVFVGGRRQGCAIGSVKSMIGHTKCAAGAAGLIKATLALHDKVLPPTLGVEVPNPKADFPASPFFVNGETRPWLTRIDGEPRRAGVSAFGFGGINFHALLEEYRGDPASDSRPLVARRWPSELFVFSAGSAAALRAEISNLMRVLEQESTPMVVDIAAATWRAAQLAAHADEDTPERSSLAIVADDLQDLRAKLLAVQSQLAQSDPPRLNETGGIYLRIGGRPALGKLAFLFPGQGSQYVDMLGQLAIHFHEVRSTFETADRVLAHQFPETLSSYIFPPSRFNEEDRTQCAKSLSRTEITQPAMGAACLAIFKLLAALGVRPDLAAGHSYGEYVALAAAGAISETDLYALSEARGRCLVEAERANPAASGAMLAALETAERVAEIVADIPCVWISNLNSPRQTTLSGTSDGIAAARERLRTVAIEIRSIPVSCGFHSPLMAEAQERLAKLLAATSFGPSSLPIFSNTTAAPYPTDAADIAELLAEHLVNPVRFRDEIDAMHRAGARIFVEVGPGAVLTGLVRETLAGRDHVAISTNSALAPLTQLQHALARLFVERIPLSLDRLYAGRVDGDPNLSPPAPKPNLWLVNGGRARRVGEPAIRPAPVRISTDLAATELPSRARPCSSNIEVAPQDADADAVMVRFQKTMTNFLDAQRRVMAAYLGTANHGDGQGSKSLADGLLASPPQRAAPAAAVPRDTNNDPVARLVGGALGELGAPVAVKDRLLAIISDRTGYPREMLKPQLNLEADLGIDSIKRVEILGAFQRECEEGRRQILQGAMEKLTALATVGSLGDSLSDLLDRGAPLNGNAPVAATLRPDLDAHPRRPEQLPRFALIAVDSVQRARPHSPALPTGAVLITDDGRGVAIALASSLAKAGSPVAVTGVDLTEQQAVALVEKWRRDHSRIAAVIHLAPLRGEPFPTTDEQCAQHIASEVKSLFHLVKAASGDLRAPGDAAATVLAATCLGGDFGVTAGEAAVSSPIQGGVIGLVKTLSLEWPETRCKVVDFQLGIAPNVAAERLFAELGPDGADPSIEVGYRYDRRLAIRIEPADLSVGPPSLRKNVPLPDNPVVLVTGGGRGITAKAALALASLYRCKLILVGRSQPPPPQEPPEIARIDSERELRRILIEHERGAGRTPDAPIIEAMHSRLLREREIRANLEAMRKTGAVVEYVQCDVADADSFGRLIDKIYSRDGRIDGVIHGAGAIEDRLVENKDSASFDRVMSAKVTGAMVLARRLRPESLAFVAFFSSVSGRFGNRGQIDYAAANEILNKLAAHLDIRWPCRVVAINWGPWDGSNMVSAPLREHFVRRGVALIEPEAGCDAFLRELMAGSKGTPEVVLGAGPWSTVKSSPPEVGSQSPAEPLMPFLGAVPSIVGGGVEVEVLLDPERHLYLDDHRIDGKPVLPAAIAVEVMAELAQEGWSDWVVTGVKSVRVCKGVVLDRGPKLVSATARSRIHSSVEGAGLEVAVEIRDPRRSSLVYYCGTVCLAKDTAGPAPARSRRSRGAPGPLTAAEAYRSRLFHGRSFQCLTGIHEFGEDEVNASLRPGVPGDCLRDACARKPWIIDPVLLDAGPQLAILWSQAIRGMTVLPTRMEEIRIHRATAPAEELDCRLVINDTTSEEAVVADFEVFTPDGQPVISVRGLELIGAPSLNRLAPNVTSLKMNDVRVSLP